MTLNSNNKLRLVTWNCNGALRKKWTDIESLNADLYIIQECENPHESDDLNYKRWGCRALWHGIRPHRGLGVFPRSGISLSPCHLSLNSFNLFIPFLLEGSPFLAAWTLGASSASRGYIYQLWGFLQENPTFLDNSKAILAGDLNSNSQWDKKRSIGNHSCVVKALNDLGIRSMYHENMDLDHGKETHPTFYMYRNEKKPYHIDYVFAGSSWKLKDFKIGVAHDWLHLSDHMPLSVDIESLS